MESSICVAVITGIRRVARFQNNLLLHDGNFFRAHFDAQIAARDHYSIGDSENFVEIIYGFRFFELGDYRRIFSGASDGEFCGAHVRSGAHETESEIIRADDQGRLQVLAVFRGQRRNIEFDSRKIDAFVFAQVSAVFHLGDDVLAVRGNHAQGDVAVAEENAVAFANGFGQRAESGADALLRCREYSAW